MENNSETTAEDVNVAALKSVLLRARLKLALHYALQAFAPVVSVVALVIAVVAANSNSEQAQQIESAARMDELKASLAEARGELENLKVVIARERSLREEERKKQDEEDTKIIQHVSQLQTKMKVSPTLEEQLRVAGSAPAVASPVSTPVSAPVASSAAKENEKQHTAATTAPAHSDQKPAAPAPAKKDSGKTPAQVKALKEAIEKLNRK